MELIKLTNENLEKEHICCAVANNKDMQTLSKKQWLRERLNDGLVFLKGNVRGKCFIEYIPAEKAWVPIEADNYMFINCFWVSGQFKGQGNSNLLLDACIKDSKDKGKSGLCVLSSEKKMPFLSDPKHLKYKGFMVADTAEPNFTLMYLPFDDHAEKPKFMPQVKQPRIGENGFVLYYTHQCPYTAKYAPLIEAAAKEKGIPFKSIHTDSLEKAKKAPCAATTYALFYNGQFITNEILSLKKFDSLCEKFGLV